MRPLAVVCLSGGMDSAVTAAIAAQEYEPALLHADYGQRTAGRERACFERLADWLGAKHKLVVQIPALGAIGGSSLTDRAIPVREAPPAHGVIPSSYVPFRNAHLLAIAGSWAEVLGARALFIGAVWEDSSGYPDCRPEFYAAFEKALRLGTRPDSDLHIVTPVIQLSKAEIVRRGQSLAVPFQWTWSCYQSDDRACGLCESCRLRLSAFAAAGVPDPLPYRTQGGS